MLGHKVDPVIGGVTYTGYTVQLPNNSMGIGATVKDDFLANCEHVVV
jgi:L-Ala-D/L-Glu epimerase